MEAKSKPIPPKPLTFKIEGSKKQATFDAEELKCFVRATDQAAFIVEDEDGNESAILVQPILEAFAKGTRPNL
jgi:hypothetical protein